MIGGDLDQPELAVAVEAAKQKLRAFQGFCDLSPTEIAVSDVEVMIASALAMEIGNLSSRSLQNYLKHHLARLNEL